MGKMPKKERAFASFTDFVTSKRAERTKPLLPPNDLDNDLAEIVFMFPDIDQEYARMCLQSYAQGRVLRVTEKLLDQNFSNYPRHVFPYATELTKRTSKLPIKIKMRSWRS